MAELAELEHRMRVLDAKIEPLIQRLDLSASDWREKLSIQAEKNRTAGLQPYVPVLDRVAIRGEAEALLREILDAHVAASPETQAAIRTLFRSFQHFAWAIGGAAQVSLRDAEPLTVERCRDVLTLFAIQDQGSDPRDAILWLQKLCGAAERSGLPLPALLTDAADRASDAPRVAKIGGQSPRQLLLDYAQRPARP